MGGTWGGSSPVDVIKLIVSCRHEFETTSRGHDRWDCRTEWTRRRRHQCAFYQRDNSACFSALTINNLRHTGRPTDRRAECACRLYLNNSYQLTPTDPRDDLHHAPSTIALYTKLDAECDQHSVDDVPWPNSLSPELRAYFWKYPNFFETV